MTKLCQSFGKLTDQEGYKNVSNNAASLETTSEQSHVQDAKKKNGSKTKTCEKSHESKPFHKSGIAEPHKDSLTSNATSLTIIPLKKQELIKEKTASPKGYETFSKSLLLGDLLLPTNRSKVKASTIAAMPNPESSGSHAEPAKQEPKKSKRRLFSDSIDGSKADFTADDNSSRFAQAISVTPITIPQKSPKHKDRKGSKPKKEKKKHKDKKKHKKHKKHDKRDSSPKKNESMGN